MFSVLIILFDCCLQAQQNTRMLSAYAAIDPRVKTIGYAMKVLAKVQSHII